MSPHPDPYRDLDAEPRLAPLIEALEERGRTRSQARLRRRFLRFVGIGRGQAALEVGCGTGVVLRDLANLVGARGRVVGVDPSRRIIRAARPLCRAHPGGRRIELRVADGAHLPCAADRFDVALAVTVLLHTSDPLAIVKEMARVTRPGGRVAVQDQDFGSVVAEHPDRDLNARILTGVAARIYEEPFSGRRLPGLLRSAGLGHVRLLTDVYQDTTLEPYTRAFIERRAENAVRFGIVDAAAARQWLDGFNRLVAAGAFVLTMNFYGAVAVKPGVKRPRSRGRG